MRDSGACRDLVRNTAALNGRATLAECLQADGDSSAEPPHVPKSV
jgi:hypothetical protein